MVLTPKEIVIVMTIMTVVVVVAIWSQVRGEFEENFCKAETLDLGLEQYIGVCQALLVFEDNRRV